MTMRRSNNQAGFSLLEVLIAMGITITIMTLATTLLAASFRIRSREDRKSDAVADVQRALNIMTREIANAGLKVPGDLLAVSKNGVVTNDSNNSKIPPAIICIPAAIDVDVPIGRRAA